MNDRNQNTETMQQLTPLSQRNGYKASHSDLIKIAKKWLKSKGCGVVLCELVSRALETPDAIGFRGDYSVLIECKISRNDFISDKKKLIRQYSEFGMGNFRFYMCPSGVIKPEDLPEKWGLIWVSERGKPRQIIGPRGSTWSYGGSSFSFKKNLYEEYCIMYSALRRVSLRNAL
jgi:hypothetical protein